MTRGHNGAASPFMWGAFIPFSMPVYPGAFGPTPLALAPPRLLGPLDAELATFLCELQMCTLKGLTNLVCQPTEYAQTDK